jgi:hypothetical protein
MSITGAAQTADIQCLSHPTSFTIVIHPQGPGPIVSIMLELTTLLKLINATISESDLKPEHPTQS